MVGDDVGVTFSFFILFDIGVVEDFFFDVDFLDVVDEEDDTGLISDFLSILTMIGVLELDFLCLAS